MNVPFFTQSIKDETKKEVLLALEAKANKADELEDLFSKKFGTTHSISTSNGTSAMHLCLCALDLKRGDKIICPINAHPFIPEVIRYFDAEPIFADIDEDNFTLNLESCREILEKNDSKKLRALILSHHAGVTPELESFYKLGKEYGIKIIEDATTALGAKYGEEMVGSTGADISIFSFFPEIQNAISSGGMMCTEDDEIALRARLLRFHAIKNDDNEMRSDIEYIYDVVDIGCKYDINQIDAAFCLVELKNVEKQIKSRLAIAEMYNTLLKGTPHIALPKKEKNHIYTNYIIKIDKNRDSFAKEMLSRGVHTSLHHIPLHLHTYYKNKYALKVNNFPNALRVYQQILSLPIFPGMTEDRVKHVCSVIKEVASTRV